MSRHKDFGRSKRPDEYEPLSFDLQGQTFECKPAISGIVLLRFVKEADSGDGGRSAEAMLKFFEQVLKKESGERFRAMADDEETIVEMETLGEIAGWIIEQYTDRPTKEPAS